MNQAYCTNCGNVLKEGSKFCSFCGIHFGANVLQEHAQLPVAQQPLVKKQMSRRVKFVYGGIGLALLFGFFLIFTSHISEQPHPVIERQSSVAMATTYADRRIAQQQVQAHVENGKIIIPLTLLLEKKIVEFDYNGPTTVVPLLAYISNEGKLVTSIRFCEPCNSKSFEIEGKELVCGNCGTRWNLNNLRGISGNCQKYPPAPIPSEIVGNQIRIDEKYALGWKLRI